MLTHFRKLLTQAGDDLRVGEAQEGVDAFLLAERGDRGRRRVMAPGELEELAGCLIARLAIERELEVARQVLVPGIDLRVVGKLRQLGDEGVVERLRAPAVEAVAGAGVEQRV